MPSLTASVVIPTMNRPAALRECISSLLSGEFRPLEIIACDQSHGDDTLLMMRELARTEGVSSLRHLRLKKPNASAARNGGLTAARGELVAFIDDDCVAHPEWLSALVEEYTASSKSEDIAAVTGSILPNFRAAVPGASQGSANTTKSLVAASSRASTVRRVFRASEGGLARGEWAPWDTGSGGSILSSRRTLLSIGGFDEGLGPGTLARAAEDIDLLYRLAYRGVIIYQPRAIVYHDAKPRRDHLASRYSYGRGMGAMLGKHLRSEGRSTARRLLILYIRHQGANALRHGAWGPVASLLTVCGLLNGVKGGRIKA